MKTFLTFLAALSTLCALGGDFPVMERRTLSYPLPDGNYMLTGTLNISHGNYDMLVYNFDTQNMRIAAETNKDRIVASTDELPYSLKALYLGNTTKAEGEEEIDDIDLRYEPDHLFVARENDLRISPHDTLVVINTEATTIIDSYYMQIRVEGMQYASSATAVVTGLSPSNYFGLNERTEDPSIGIAFDLNKSIDPRIAGDNKDVLCAVFNTFGKIPDSNSDLRVTFNVVDVAGNLLRYETSLNQVFLTEDAIERHWLLINDTITIEDPDKDKPQAGGGFQPTVDDWEEEYGEIAL